MKIRRLLLSAFGKFTNVELDLPTTPGTVCIIYGKNEAGKTSALRALNGLCFGLGERPQDSFLHAYDQMKVGAEFLLDSGESQTFYRRKRRKNTLVDADDKPIEESELHRFLCGVGEEAFRSLYYLSYERLTEGADDLTKENGELGRLLSDARSDRSLKQIQTKLSEQSSKLFKGTARSASIIDKSLSEYSELRKTLRKGDLSKYSEVQEERAKLDTLAAEVAKERSRLIGAREQLRARLESIPARDELFQATKSLEALGPFIEISADQQERMAAVVAAIHSKEQTIQSCDDEIDFLTSQLEGLALDPELLANRAKVRAALQPLALIEKHLEDIPKRRSERESLDAAVTGALSEVWGANPPDVASLDSIQLQDAVSRLVQEFTKIDTQLQQKRSRLDEDKKRLAKCRQDLELLAIPETEKHVSSLLQSFRGQELSETDFKKQEAALLQLTAQLNAKKAELGGASLSLEAFAALQVPNEQAISDAAEEYGRLLDRVNDRVRQAQEKEGSLLQLKQELAGLTANRDIPSAERLGETRAKRQRSWMNLKGHLSSPTVAEPTEVAQFEQLQLSADETADALRAESELVAQIATVSERVEHLSEELAMLQSQLADAESRLSAWQLRWSDRWQLLGIVADTPYAMRDWLKEFRTLQTDAALLVKHTQDLELLRGKLLEMKTALAVALQIPELLTLDVLVAEATNTIQAASRASGEQKSLRGQERQLVDAIKSAQSEIQTLEADLQDWDARWSVLVDQLRLTSGSPVESVQSASKAFADAQVSYRSAAHTADRIQKMERDIRDFETALRDVLSQRAPDLLDRSEVDAAHTLQDRLQKAESAEAAAQSAQESIDRKDAERSKARIELDSAQSRLAQLLSEAKCQSLEEFHQNLEITQQAKGFRLEIQKQEAILRSRLGTMDREALFEVLRPLDRDSLIQQEQDADSSITQLSDQINQLNQSIGELNNRLRGLDNDDSLLETQFKAQSALAKIKSSVRPYLVAMLGEHLIRAQIEAFRKANQGPILEKASEIFRALSDDSFTELTAEVDEKDQIVLVAVRPAPHTGAEQRLQVGALSSATRIGLYLSLRLACIYHQLQIREGVPFVADDILLDFDNARAERVLEEFAKLAEATQVVMFTHHQHLVDLAKQKLGDRCRVLELAR